MNYIVMILRTLFFHIDRVVYEGIGIVYYLLLKLARTTIIDSATIEGVYGRIYALIGIFMLFKISLSLINYVLNPDEFIDKEKGMASIVKRIIISLVMLVLIPYGFKEAYALQTIILEDNTLAALIFGEVNNDTAFQIDTAGEKMKFILMYSFFQPNYEGLAQEDGNVDDSLASCAITYEYGDEGSVLMDPDTGVFRLNQECFGKYNSSDGTYSTGNDSDKSAYSKLWDYIDDGDALYQTYAQGIARQNFYLMFRHDIVMMEKEDAEGVYLVDYMSPLSTAIGIAVLWILLMFCIDVSVRSIKLSFYQLIAPIPILSYIDPKSKDGMFSKWLKQCGTTYVSLFIRLLALYMAIFLISQVMKSGIIDVITGERVDDWVIKIFVIVAALMFAKQLPKILEDALGIKGTGDFTINPVKKLEDGMIGGKTLAKPLKAVGALCKGAALGATVGVGTALGVGAAGVLTCQWLRAGAMGKAIMGAARGDKFGKNFSSSYGAGRARKKELDKMKADGVSPWAVRGEKVYNAFHGETRAERVADLEAQGKAIQSYYETIKNQAIACDKTDTTRINPTTGATEYVKSAKTLSKELDEIKKTQIDRTAFHDYVDASGHTVTASDQYNQAVQDQMRAVQDKEKELENRINDLAQGRVRTGEKSADQIIASATKSMQALVKQSNELGKSLSSTFVEIPQTLADDRDVVAMFKKSKGTVAQASSGEFTTIKDRGKYADGGGKK